MKNININSFNSPAMVFFDWALALAAIAYGVYLLASGDSGWMSYAVVIGGLFGCAFAYLRPANIIKNNLRNKLVKR